MNLLDEPIASPPIQPLTPTPAVVFRAEKKSLPHDILVRIFLQLPVSSLVNVAATCRQFKALVYNDMIWDAKLRLILNHGVPVSVADNRANTLVGSNKNVAIDGNSLSEWMPELLKGSSGAGIKYTLSGKSRDKFKQLHALLLPYYLDLRRTHGQSKVLSDFGARPEECAKTLRMLEGFGACYVVNDWNQINDHLQALCQYFESVLLHAFEVAYDAHDLVNMKKYASALITLNGGALCIQTFIQKHPLFFERKFRPNDNYAIAINDLGPFQEFMSAVCDACKQQSHVVADVFPASADLFYIFVENVLNDVIAGYVGDLLQIAQATDTRLYLYSTSVVLAAMVNLVDLVTSESLPQRLDKERASSLLLYTFFTPFIDDYLFVEEAFVKATCKKHIEAWVRESTAGKKEDESTHLSNQSRETLKRDYLFAFKKVILLPVDLVSSAATTMSLPFHKTKALPEEQPLSRTSTDSTPPLTPQTTSFTSASQASPDTRSQRSSLSSRNSLRSIDVRAADLKSTLQGLDGLQDILSLETVLQLIHCNKDAERRLAHFIRAGFPGRVGMDIQRAYERIFVHLLTFLGSGHIQPAFDIAIKHLDSYTPDPTTFDTTASAVPPLTEFFEMVHIGDVIQQMVQLYYDEEISKFVDKHDFMNECNKEKKAFERILDDCVAIGMDRGIEVLISQTSLILRHTQSPKDYSPPEGMVMDLNPTKACRASIECLVRNTSMLRGAAEKATMDLFFSEIGRRFSEVLSKHLKTQKVNEAGGFRYICDMNAYYDFAVSLHQKSVTPYFAALKSLANIYIISSVADIKAVIHDLERYHGLMNTEDVLEFAACRSDWPIIRKEVQKDILDCTVM